jgi:hypothetical protein
MGAGEEDFHRNKFSGCESIVNEMNALRLHANIVQRIYTYA